LPFCCPAPLAVEIIPGSSRPRFRDRPETVRLHRGIGVHHHPGILFGFTPLGSPRNGVRNHPGIAFTLDRVPQRSENGFRDERAARILKPVNEVFDAVVDPNKMSNYFISGTSGPIQLGKVEWEFGDLALRCQLMCWRSNLGSFWNQAR
jgi:hypothetical protein